MLLDLNHCTILTILCIDLDASAAPSPHLMAASHQVINRDLDTMEINVDVAIYSNTASMSNTEEEVFIHVEY